jgi:transcriptional regulator with XRE-family HTH domain
MAKNPSAPKHYIKQWRDKSGLSLARLAARMETVPGEELISAMSLSRIERGLQPYSEPILEALSLALDVPKWALISVNPEKDGDVVDLMTLIRKQSPAERQRAIRLLKAVNE